MWSIFFRVDKAAQDALVTELWERGTCGIADEADGLRAFFDRGEEHNAIAEISGVTRGEWRREPEALRTDFERDGWDPLLIGAKFYVAPPWVETPGPAGRMRLIMDAASAFGTGRHETTQLCIEAMEWTLHPGEVVLDVGCGSGILSAASRLLGAETVFGCDIHEDAVSTARGHVSTPVFLGSADAVATATADLVLANISAAVLDQLAANLKRVAKPGGRLILSGFLRDRVPRHYRPREVLEKEGWLCWICAPEDIQGTRETEENEELEHKAEWWL